MFVVSQVVAAPAEVVAPVASVALVEPVAPVALVAPGVAALVATGFVEAFVVVLLLVVKRSEVYHLAFVPIAAQEVGPALEFCHHLNAQFELSAGFVVVVALRGWH